MRPRRLRPGDAFTWRFKTKDYWQAVAAPRPIETVEELMALHEPWATSRAQHVLQVLDDHGLEPSLDDEGLIAVEIDDTRLNQVNQDLARLGCTLSNELLHTV